MKRYIIGGIILTFVLTGCKGKSGTTKNVTVKEAPTKVNEFVQKNESTPNNEVTVEITKALKEEEKAQNEKDDKKVGGEQKFLHIINTESFCDTEWNNEEQKLYYHQVAEKVEVLEDGYDGLKKTLKKINSENLEKVKRDYSEATEEFKTSNEKIPEHYELEQTNEIYRADNQILSFISDWYYSLGGAHPTLHRESHNIDPRTGKVLSLKDITEDYDKVYKAVLNELEKINNSEEWKDGYDSNYKETVKELFYEKDGKNLVWSLDQEKLTIYFDAYAIASYARGETVLTFCMEEYKDFIKDKYQRKTKEYMKSIPFFEDIPIEVDGTEQKLNVSFQQSKQEEELNVEYTIEYAGNKICKKIEGMINNAYLLKTKDSKNYLYLQMSGLSDYSSILIFKIENDKVTKVSEMVGTLENYFVQTPEEFIIFCSVDILGTYQGYKRYTIDEQGIPVPKDQKYILAFFNYPEPTCLISTRELQVYDCKDGKKQGKGYQLPKKTKFYPVATDGETYVEMQLKDGKRCLIEVEREEYHFNINGVNEMDCFEMVPYAG